MKEFDDLKFYGMRNRQKYLNNTDWMPIREIEGGEIEPQEVKDKRQQARDEISLLRDSTEYSQVQHLTIEF